MTIEAEGYSGTVEFDGEMIAMKPSRRLKPQGRGEAHERVPLSSVQALSHVPPRKFPPPVGSLSFTVLGAQEKQTRMSPRVGRAIRDDNAVAIQWWQREQFDALVEAIASAQRALLHRS